MEHVMCPELYQRLQKVFGSVTIMNQMERTEVEIGQDARTGRRVTRAVASGEYYCVRCAFCSDARQHLEINYRWAEFPWMAHCFREGCLEGAKGRINRIKLRQMVFGTLAPPPKLKINAVPTITGPVQPVPVRLPDEFVFLTDLDADHPAVNYLTGRGFNRAELARVYGVGYCAEVPQEICATANRIFIPVKMNGVLVGWQARAPRDAPRTGFGADRYPKYLNYDRFKRGSALYGFDAARDSDFVVVCEGVTDVWKVGRPAVALFGKQATQEQRQLLIRHWGHGSLIVLLDADARDDAGRLGRELGRYFRKGAIVVPLPAGTDPGGLSRGTVWGYIRNDVRAAGIELSLSV